MALPLGRAVTMREESLEAFGGGKDVMRRKVLAWLEAHGQAGATADELCAETGLSPNSIAPRLTELCAEGLAVRTNKRRATRSVMADGRRCTAAVIVAERWL
jgi:predicted Rossmann fold nucleotide-binding protein DprA/Smf involved in DNA uptake